MTKCSALIELTIPMWIDKIMNALCKIFCVNLGTADSWELAHCQMPI